MLGRAQPGDSPRGSAAEGQRTPHRTDFNGHDRRYWKYWNREVGLSSRETGDHRQGWAEVLENVRQAQEGSRTLVQEVQGDLVGHETWSSERLEPT